LKTILILILLVPSCSPGRQESPAESHEPEAQLRPVAGDRSEPWFAEVINERAKAANLAPLSSKKLSGSDLEFRVWVGFGKKPLEGFVIERVRGQWKGTFLESNGTTRHLPSPNSGWEGLWFQVVDSGLLTLPDFSQLKDYAPVVDGTSYEVEVKKDGIYRTYAYMNPDYQEWKEAKQLLKIADILYTDFGVERYPRPQE
jgi:hypothetical protein